MHRPFRGGISHSWRVRAALFSLASACFHRLALVFLLIAGCFRSFVSPSRPTIAGHVRNFMLSPWWTTRTPRVDRALKPTNRQLGTSGLFDLMHASQLWVSLGNSLCGKRALTWFPGILVVQWMITHLWAQPYPYLIGTSPHLCGPVPPWMRDLPSPEVGESCGRGNPNFLPS